MWIVKTSTINSASLFIGVCILFHIAGWLSDATLALASPTLLRFIGDGSNPGFTYETDLDRTTANQHNSLSSSEFLQTHRPRPLSSLRLYNLVIKMAARHSELDNA